MSWIKRAADWLAMRLFWWSARETHGTFCIMFEDMEVGVLSRCVTALNDAVSRMENTAAFARGQELVDAQDTLRSLADVLQAQLYQQLDARSYGLESEAPARRGLFNPKGEV